MELLFSPAFHTVRIDADSGCYELPLSETGCCTLPAIAPAAGFELFVDGNHLCHTSQRQLAELDARIAVLEAHTALRAYDFRPSGETSVFYRNDREVVLLVRYGQVIHDCPVVVSWYHQAELIYSEVVLLPRQEQPGGERVHGRGVVILPDMPKGEWRVAGHLLTGRQLFELPFRLLDRDRAAYGMVFD